MYQTSGILQYSSGGTPSVIYKRILYTDYTQAGTADSSNFPVLISLSDSSLKTIANGGHVANSNGYDILLYSDSAYSVLMNWEIKFYDPVNGIVVFFAKAVTVSHTVNSLIFMAYGDNTISTFQGGSLGSAWNANYQGVWHFPNGTILSPNDSTSNGYNLTNSGGTATSGLNDGALSLSGSPNFEPRDKSSH